MLHKRFDKCPNACTMASTSEIEVVVTMNETDRKAHLKLRPTRPDQARALALAEAVFFALALRGAPGQPAEAPRLASRASRR